MLGDPGIRAPNLRESLAKPTSLTGAIKAAEMSWAYQEKFRNLVSQKANCIGFHLVVRTGRLAGTRDREGGLRSRYEDVAAG